MVGETRKKTIKMQALLRATQIWEIAVSHDRQRTVGICRIKEEKKNTTRRQVKAMYTIKYMTLYLL